MPGPGANGGLQHRIVLQTHERSIGQTWLEPGPGMPSRIDLSMKQGCEFDHDNWLSVAELWPLPGVFYPATSHSRRTGLESVAGGPKWRLHVEKNTGGVQWPGVKED